MAIKTEFVIDNMVCRPNPIPANDLAFPNVQKCAYFAQVLSLQLLDHGFYTHSKDYSISLESDLLTFGENLIHWLRKLSAFRNHCNKNQIIYSTAANQKKQEHIDTAFGLKIQNNPLNQINKNWVRGTFIMPAFGKEPFFQKKFLPANNIDSLNEETMEKENLTLIDRTLISRRVWKEKELKKLMKSKKRKNRSSEKA